jgi:hypothetical protein
MKMAHFWKIGHWREHVARSKIPRRPTQSDLPPEGPVRIPTMPVGYSDLIPATIPI